MGLRHLNEDLESLNICTQLQGFGKAAFNKMLNAVCLIVF
jgi:hypothetical protein